MRGAGGSSDVSAAMIRRSTMALATASLFEITATRKPLSGSQLSTLLKPFMPPPCPITR